MNEISISYENPSIFNSTKFKLSTLKPKFQPNNLNFLNTHLSKQSLSLIKVHKSSCFGFNPKPRATTMIMNTYMTTKTESLYDLMGVSETVSIIEIKRAYKKLVRKYHPDVSPPEFIEEHTMKFIRVHEAYETLSDPKNRALYDQHLASGFLMGFSDRNQLHKNEVWKQGIVEKDEWRNQWWSQLQELKWKRMEKESRSEKMSWGSRMRIQRNETKV